MTLPEVDLGLLDVQDHKEHHATMHDLWNKLLVDATLEGEVLMKTSPGTGAATVGTAQPHFTFASQIRTFTHSSPGPLAISATRQTRAIRVNASADITGLSLTGLELVGDGFSQVWVRILATSASLSLDLSSGIVEVVGSPPTTLSLGEAARFIVQRWDT